LYITGEKLQPKPLAEVLVTERAGAGRSDFTYKNTELDGESWG